MSNLLQKLARSGRTTRMLEHAEKLAREGRAVYVVAPNSDMRRALEGFCGEPGLGIKFETPTTLRNLDWETMRLRGAHPNCVVLVDHYTIEDRFARVLEMLHAYDEPADGARPSCFGSSEVNHPQHRAENCCSDCKHEPRCHQAFTASALKSLREWRA